MEGYPERYRERHFGTGTVGKAWWGWPVEEGMEKVAHWGRYGEGWPIGEGMVGVVHREFMVGDGPLGNSWWRMIHWGRHGEAGPLGKVW